MRLLSRQQTRYFWCLTRVLAHTNDDDAERQQRKDPAEADDDAEVDLLAIHAPSASEDVPQRFDGVRLRQEVRDVAQVDGHALHGPQHSTEQQVGVEAAQRQVDGARLFVAQTRHDESCTDQSHQSVEPRLKQLNQPPSSYRKTFRTILARG